MNRLKFKINFLEHSTVNKFKTLNIVKKNNKVNHIKFQSPTAWELIKLDKEQAHFLFLGPFDTLFVTGFSIVYMYSEICRSRLYVNVWQGKKQNPGKWDLGQDEPESINIYLKYIYG